MTILDTTNRRFYTGNGTATTYAINSLSGDALTGITIFKITDIKVYLGGVLQTYTTDYTITSDTPPSAFAGKLVNASVVFVTAPLASVEIAIVREVPYTQELGLSNGNNVAPKPLESQLDKLAVQTQQLSEVLTDRVLRVEAFESSLLDPITVENGSYLKWDAGQLINATPIDVGVDISDATIAQVATNTANIATNTANIATNTADIAVLETVHVPTGYINTPVPQYATARTVTVNGTAAAKSGDGLYNLLAAGNNTVSLNTTGLNGLATGTVANNTWYYLYLVSLSDGTGGGYLFDTAQNVNSHVISGVTYRSRQLPLAVRTDASSNILPFVMKNWNGRTSSTIYRDSEETSAYQVLNGGTASTFTAVSCSSLVPPNSRIATMNISADGDTGGGAGKAWTRETGASITTGKQVAYWNLAVGNWNSPSVYHNTQTLNASQQFDYRRNFGSISIWITGYTINL